ncbi:MAG TPA: DMT family transporter [Burkholderiales bacterium]|jgi:drug/metabolite transporter (DMT)-like permease|nr:DMT family transporter [Burkholderiales bacterium]
MSWFFPGLFVLLWSTGFVGAKLGLPYAEPFTFLELRFLCVLALLMPLCWLTQAPWPSRRRVMQMAVSGGLIQAGYLGGVFASLHHGMPAGVSALVTGMQPVFTAVLGGWLLREAVTARQWLGLVLGLGGVLLVVGDRIVVEHLSALSVALSVFALLSITLGTLWQKRHGAGVDLRTGAAIQFMAAAVLIAPFTLLESRAVQWSGEFLFALAWLTVVLSLGAIFLLLTLIKRGRATQVSSLFYLVPPTTALIAWPLFGETYSPAAAAGMGLAMLAVWLVMKA